MGAGNIDGYLIMTFCRGNDQEIASGNVFGCSDDGRHYADIFAFGGNPHPFLEWAQLGTMHRVSEQLGSGPL